MISMASETQSRFKRSANNSVILPYALKLRAQPAAEKAPQVMDLDKVTFLAVADQRKIKLLTIKCKKYIMSTELLR